MAFERWARLREDAYCGLRRGAWYKVLFSGPDLVAVEVERERLLVSRHVLEFVEVRPATWTVVLHTRDSVSFPPDRGRRYAVCPNCRHRQVPVGRPHTLRCQRCNWLFAVEWRKPVIVSDVLSESPAFAG